MRSPVPTCAHVLFLLSLVGHRAALAQARAPAAVNLDHASTELANSFSQLSGLVELRDGRLIVLDAKEKELRLVDLSRGTSARISRLGGGPLEYQAPGLLLTGAADTVVYFDVMQRRFLLLSQGGVALGTQPYGATRKPGTPADVQSMMSQMVPTSMDARGRLYGVTTGISIAGFDGKSAPSMPIFADTVDIQTLDRHTGQSTTLARIRSPMAQSSPKIQMTGAGIKITLTAPDFRPGTVWAVLPDGRIAVLRDGEYRVHFMTPGGTETVGPTIPYVPVAVTAAERRALMDSVRRSLDVMLKTMTNTAAEGGAGNLMPKFDAQALEPATWAATKPPYSALVSAPDGRLWVALSTPTGSNVTRLDLLAPTGALLAHVQLAPREQFVGVGRGTVYTIRTDEDDLQYLRRYTLPRLP